MGSTSGQDCPDKGLGVFVGEDGSLQFAAALVHPTAQLLFGEQPKPALHQVQPGGAGGLVPDKQITLFSSVEPPGKMLGI